MKTIGIIGSGFTGTMAAVQLIDQAKSPCRILLFGDRETFNRGIAYSPYSRKHLLNVPAEKMSAFPDQPHHFLEWILDRYEFKDQDPNLVAAAFLPRQLYGEYLSAIWKQAVTKAVVKHILISCIYQPVVRIKPGPDGVLLILKDGELLVEDAVIATGNAAPRNPAIPNTSVFTHPQYFRNPWKADAVRNADPDLPVLIIGNGLSMVDTVLGLLEQGFANQIYTLSPHGFSLLPHRHNGLKYEKLTADFSEPLTLAATLDRVHRHIKIVNRLGFSAEPVIDAIRPFTQTLWTGFSDQEKAVFMSRLRHLWGIARHRIPLHIHEQIQQLRNSGKLQIISGDLRNIDYRKHSFLIDFQYRQDKIMKQIEVSRVINCTGPENDLRFLEGHFLKRALEEGYLCPDPFRLGIGADGDTFQALDTGGAPQPHVYIMGSGLKGVLWESTAVAELRMQAKLLGKALAGKMIGEYVN